MIGEVQPADDLILKEATSLEQEMKELSLRDRRLYLLDIVAHEKENPFRVRAASLLVNTVGRLGP